MTIICIILICALLVLGVLYVRQQGSLAASREECARLQERVAALASENERIAVAHERSEKEAEQRFADIAARTLAGNAESLRLQSSATLAEVLAPMKENLENFRKAFTERYDREAAERFSLSEKVGELARLNYAIGQETRRLTDALKGNSGVQGDWGEIMLDNILEHAGLRRGVDYKVQQSVTDAEGRRLRPDVVISYTGDRKLIIDSKVSIQDYLAMLRADDESMRSRYARAHVASVRKHVSELKNKSYQDIVDGGKVDFVLMFIPHEGAYMAAMSLDESLWQTAYDSRVLIISPTHLLSIVRLVEQMWRRDRQDRNAEEIARQAGLLLDKLRGFTEDMDRMDRSLVAAREAWDAAFSKLTKGPGNLMSRAASLQALGASPRKPIGPRYLAPEDDVGPDDSTRNL